MKERERIQQYLQPFDMLADAVIAIDDRMRIVYANPATERIYHLDTTARERPLQELVGIENPDLNPVEIVSAVLEQGSWTGQVRHTGEAFDPVWVDMRLQRLDLPDLESQYILGIARDVGAQRLAEEALKESEQRLRIVTDNMFDMVSLSDSTGTIQYASASHERILGYPPRGLLGVNAFELLHPDDQERAAAELILGSETGEARRAEMRLRHADGSYVWLECIGQLVMDAEGQPTQMVFSSRDISERKRTETELQQSEGRYQALFENMSSGVAVYEAVDDGADFVIRAFNHAGEATSGLTRRDVLDKRLSEAFPGAVEMGLRAVLRRVWQTGEPERHESTRYEDDRLSAWYQNHVYRLPSGEVVAVFDDVSDEAKAREELRLHDETLQSIFRAAPTGIGVTRNQRMARVNRLICKMTGWAMEELVGQDTQILYPSRRAHERAEEESARQIAAHGVSTVETQWRRKDGEILDVLLSSTPIDADDLSAGVTFTTLNITARKRAAREQRLIIRVLELLNRVGDESLMIRDILRMLQDFTGCEVVALRLRVDNDYPFFEALGLPEKHMKSENHIALLDDDEQPLLDARGQPRLRCLCGAVIRGRGDLSQPYFTLGGSFWSGCTSELWAAGPPLVDQERPTARCYTEGYESLTLVPLRSDAEVIGLLHLADHRKHVFSADTVGFFEQIGTSIGIALARAQAGEQRRNLEHQLQQSQKMEAIGRLAGGVAHDFNNLLTAIGGYSQLVMGALDEADPLRQDVQEIEDAADRAGELTKQLLAFSRRQIVAPKIIDPNLVIARSEKMLRRIIGEDVTLAFVSEDSVGSIEIDPGQLDQILVNLSVNARDAMPDGGQLVIETTRWNPSHSTEPLQPQLRTGDFVRLDVTDSGQGIAEDVLPHIFEPFFSTKGSGEGTGLGLATVYGIVSQNRGVIEARSEPGRFTTFSIYFPRVRAAPQTLDELPATKTPRGNETILLVEDESSLRGLALKILKRHGYRVMEASNGGEAYLLSQQTEEHIDLLLTDVVMPNMNGKQLFESLSSERPDLRVLYMSGYTDATIAHHGVLEHDTEFLQKPFTFEALARKVRAVLDRPD